MKKKLKEVTISPGCIACGACEAICPDVFEVRDLSHVKEKVDFLSHESCIQEAAEACPVSAIELCWEE